MSSVDVVCAIEIFKGYSTLAVMRVELMSRQVHDDFSKLVLMLKRKPMQLS
jgi:hypothetical protein